MTWNNRVMYRKMEHSGEEWFSIHEVYYDGDGNIDNYTKDGIEAGGNTIEELRAELQRMLACLDEPVVDYKTGKEITKASQ